MPPTSTPTTGMTMSATSEETIFPKAAPMITPTARSTTLPFTAKSRNSVRILTAPSQARRCLQVLYFEDLHFIVSGGRPERDGIALARLQQRPGDRRDPRHPA